ncbi:hypothetical protein ACHAW5_007296 [Stephanodiscus triporus]|uniref:Uncharacterized protein n=1 Tax=Stephanodiscus triporus TaxID=2934178 RepID=A0ABD3NDH8_9STRA
MRARRTTTLYRALSDNAFWNSLKAKAAEILDSVGIYIENRIERDSGILAAVGIFAVDRIRRDVGRALPAAGRAARTLLLAANSTYAERLLEQSAPFALPSSASSSFVAAEDDDDDDDDRESDGALLLPSTTPAEEVREVVEAIRDILSGRDIASSSSSRRRAVKSLAPAGTARLAERQRLAYGARRRTVLRREREGIDRRIGRAVGSVSDATWEFRREMQTDEGREAGYRSRGVRRALAAGATRLLEAGRVGGRMLLSSGGGDEGRRNLLGGNAGGGADDVAGVSRSNVVDVSPLEEEEIIAKVMEETNVDYATDGLLSPRSFFEEKRRLVASLESCLSQPSETWLTKDVVAQAVGSGISLDGSVLREVIATMVNLRDQLQREIEEIVDEQVDLKIEYIQRELRRMKQMVDSVSSLAISAAGDSAAKLLKVELEGFVLSDSLEDIIEVELERVEQHLADLVAAREEEMRRFREQRYEEVAVETVVATEFIGTDRRRKSPSRNIRYDDETFTEVEVISAPDRAAFSYESTFNREGQDPYQMPSRVEVVSDTEYSEYEQKFKYAQSDISREEVDASDANKENPAIDFALRVVDAIFFFGEKFFLVILPDLIAICAKASSRYDEAQKRGRGSEGWKPVKNFKRKR